MANALRLFVPAKAARKPRKTNSIRIEANGPGTIRVWTAEEWQNLKIRPLVAHECANGTRLTFTLD